MAISSWLKLYSQLWVFSLIFLVAALIYESFVLPIFGIFNSLNGWFLITQQLRDDLKYHLNKGEYFSCVCRFVITPWIHYGKEIILFGFGLRYFFFKDILLLFIPDWLIRFLQNILPNKDEANDLPPLEVDPNILNKVRISKSLQFIPISVQNDPKVCSCVVYDEIFGVIPLDMKEIWIPFDSENQMIHPNANTKHPLPPVRNSKNFSYTASKYMGVSK